MPQAEPRGRARGPPPFVGRGVARERQRVGGHVAAHADERRDERAVDPAGQEDPEGPLHLEPVLDRGPQRVEHAALRIVRRRGHGDGRRRHPMERDGQVGPHLEHVAGLEARHAFDRRPRAEDGAVAEDLRDRVRVGARDHEARREERVDGRGEHQPARGPRPRERPDAGGVAPEQQGAVGPGEERERIRPLDAGEPGDAVALEEGGEDLAVAPGAERLAAGDELGAERVVVVDLAVHDEHRARRTHERLPAARHVDEGEPARPERHGSHPESTGRAPPAVRPSGARDASAGAGGRARREDRPRPRRRCRTCRFESPVGGARVDAALRRTIIDHHRPKPRGACVPMARPAARAPPTRAHTTRPSTLRLVLTTVPPGAPRASPVPSWRARRPRGGPPGGGGTAPVGTAACVNIVRGVRSVYRWQGRVHDDAEALLIVKTTRASLPRCLAALAAAHPYDVPEIVVLTPGEVSTAYDAWARATTAPPRSPRATSPGPRVARRPRA